MSDVFYAVTYDGTWISTFYPWLRLARSYSTAKRYNANKLSALQTQLVSVVARQQIWRKHDPHKLKVHKFLIDSGLSSREVEMEPLWLHAVSFNTQPRTVFKNGKETGTTSILRDRFYWADTQLSHDELLKKVQTDTPNIKDYYGNQVKILDVLACDHYNFS